MHETYLLRKDTLYTNMAGQFGTIVWQKYEQHQSEPIMAKKLNIHARPETIKKSGAWIGAQITIFCSINRHLRSGD